MANGIWTMELRLAEANTIAVSKTIYRLLFTIHQSKEI